jgi:hypothetical protein
MKFLATLTLLLGLGCLVLAHDHDAVDSNNLRTETKPKEREFQYVDSRLFSRSNENVEGRSCVDYKDWKESEYELDCSW